MWSRCRLPRRVVPLLTARPKTSFPESEDKERKIARQAKSATTVTPSEDPLSANAASAMSAAQSACPSEPNIQICFRDSCDVTQPRSAACGSIANDSRTGTSKPENAAGTPAAVNNQGKTVLAEAVWSPMFCRALAIAIWRPLCCWLRAVREEPGFIIPG